MLNLGLILSSHREYAQTMRAALLGLEGKRANVDVELDALRAVQLVPQNYELILIDRILNSMDGLQLLLLFKQQAPATKFVLVNDRNDETSRAEAYQNGADLFLERNTTPEALQMSLGAIRTLLQRDRGAQPSATVPEEPLADLVDTIQTRCLSGDSVLLQVRAQGQSGDIFIYHGEVFHAQFPGRSGKPAFHEMLAWDGGRVRIKALKINHLPPRTIETPYRILLAQMPQLDVDEADLRPFGESLSVPIKGPDDPRSAVLLEAPPRAEVLPPGEARSGQGETALPPVNAHWKINLMGGLVEGSQVSEQDRCAFITYFIYRKLADVAVALEVDYFNHMTLWGPHLEQVLVADNMGVRHAVFETSRTDEAQREQYVKWCREQSF